LTVAFDVTGHVFSSVTVPGWRTELTPFGGVGDSGLGVKEGVREAIKACTHVKLDTLPWS
jgi:aldehyde dehydrogenase (NAD+)